MLFRSESYFQSQSALFRKTFLLSVFEADVNRLLNVNADYDYYHLAV